jgi:hypothetical protein
MDMKSRLNHRIESLKKELQKLQDELEPKIEVGSWWFGNQSEEKVQVTKIDKKRVYYTYEDGCEGVLQFHNFTNRFTPCEAPAKETWYLCTKDYQSGGGCDFKRGQEYKLIPTNGFHLVRFEVDGKSKSINRPIQRGIMVSPQER